jgi:hypothetical protein
MPVHERTQSTATSRMSLEIPHTFYLLPPTNARDRSQTLPLIAHTSVKAEVGYHGDNCFTSQLKDTIV